jgi:hypothetical protein
MGFAAALHKESSQERQPLLLFNGDKPHQALEEVRLRRPDRTVTVLL